MCVRKLHSGSIRKEQRGNISVLFLQPHSPVPPPPPQKRERIAGHSQTRSPLLQPRVKPERKTEKEKKSGEEGRASAMCFKDGRPPARCTAPRSCFADGRLCGNQRWPLSSTSANSAASHTKKIQHLRPTHLLRTFKLTFREIKAGLGALLAVLSLPKPQAFCQECKGQL